MTSTLRRRLIGWAGVAVLLVVPSAAVGPSAADTPGPAATRAALPLGPTGLNEVRTTRTLQRGVTMTTIVRGAVDPAHFWTVELSIPAGATSPDPDAPPTSLSDLPSAEALAARARTAGYSPRVEEVVTPRTADYSGGRLGWRVRIDRLASEAAAGELLARLVGDGFSGAARFTGWDGTPSDRGPWRLQLLTVDPQAFRGRLLASYGPDLEERETTSALSRDAGATAAVNAGYFVLDPKAGAPGDPAGVGVYRGRLLSETVRDRPALVVRESGRRTDVERLDWRGTVTGRGLRLALDGLDRVPGLIRNCGGTADDLPTASPLHDSTCTDDDELIAFSRQFGPSTPSGPGLEAVIDRQQRVVSLRSPRGGPLPAGHRSVQATGSLEPRLRSAAVVGSRLHISARLADERGRTVSTSGSTSIVNGGPELVRNSRVHVTPDADGYVRPADPSFYYGFSHNRTPRTFAGVDAAGRTLLVTADGRRTTSLGLSLTETGAVARSLGMREALNLDGGGSTTMVVGGQVINQPSDATGERPVGDALLILPDRS